MEYEDIFTPTGRISQKALENFLRIKKEKDELQKRVTALRKELNNLEAVIIQGINMGHEVVPGKLVCEVKQGRLVVPWEKAFRDFFPDAVEAVKEEYGHRKPYLIVKEKK